MTQKVIDVLKTMVISYIITAVILFILAFGLYKFGLSEWQVTAGIIVTYAVSAFVGGYCLAKMQRSRRLFWGIGFGILYCGILLVVSLCLNKGLAIDTTAAVRAAIVSVCAGAIGGFATPVTR